MTDTTKMPAPEFTDEDAQAVQTAQNALMDGKFAPLTVPDSATYFKSDKSDTIFRRWTEQVTIERAYRSVNNAGDKMDVALMLRVRQSEKNSGRSFWSHLYISFTTEGLAPSQVEYREKQRALMFDLITATGFMPESKRLTGALQTMLFPQKGEPGKQSPLVGKTVFAQICQTDKPANDRKKQAIYDESGKRAREVRDQVEGWIAGDEA